MSNTQSIAWISLKRKPIESPEFRIYKIFSKVFSFAKAFFSLLRQAENVMYFIWFYWCALNFKPCSMFAGFPYKISTRTSNYVHSFCYFLLNKLWNNLVTIETMESL